MNSPHDANAIVEQRSRPSTVICGVYLVMVAIGSQAAVGQKPVNVARVTEADVSSGQRVVGTVNPLRASTIGSAVDGRVLELLVDRGDAVKEGQPLAKLRTLTLEIELAAAQAELELYRQQLAEVKNGSRVEDIAEAEANMQAAKVANQNAQDKLRRVQSLSASRAASVADLEDAQAEADATRFALTATEALLQRIKQGPRQEAIAQAAARVELQIQRVRLLEDRITKFTIAAPFDGFVAEKFTEVGAWITIGDPIVQVVQLNEVEIQAAATAEYALRLQRGDAIRVEFPELPEQLLTGTVDRIVPVAETRTRTFPVFVRMTNQMRSGDRPLLMAGMLARVFLPSGRRQRMPLVPKDALVLNGTDRAVFVVDLDSPSSTGVASSPRIGTVRKVPVDLGIAVEGKIQVRGDVAANQLVVVVGNERLIAGSKVSVTEVGPSEGSSSGAEKRNEAL
jgi:RND family efflux transporter MFP subunit